MLLGGWVIDVVDIVEIFDCPLINSITKTTITHRRRTIRPNKKFVDNTKPEGGIGRLSDVDGGSGDGVAV
jgi:hypothetical protein